MSLLHLPCQPLQNIFGQRSRHGLSRVHIQHGLDHFRLPRWRLWRLRTLSHRLLSKSRPLQPQPVPWRPLQPRLVPWRRLQLLACSFGLRRLPLYSRWTAAAAPRQRPRRLPAASAALTPPVFFVGAPGTTPPGLSAPDDRRERAEGEPRHQGVHAPLLTRVPGFFFFESRAGHDRCCPVFAGPLPAPAGDFRRRRW